MARVHEAVSRSTAPQPMTPGLLTPLPWPDWSSRIRSLEVDGATVDYVEMGPYDIDVPAAEDRPDLPVRMMLVVILEGTSYGRVGGRRLTLSPRQAAIIDGRAAMSFHAPEPVRAVRMFVEQHHVPAEVMSDFDPPFVRLKHTPLVTGCIGLITGLLQVGNPVIEPRDEEAVSQPLIALLVSLLGEALHDDRARSGSRDPERRDDGGRRARIEAFVDQHIADRDLTVGTIAEALGVSVRSIHGAYRDSGTTVGADIRSRRIARARTLLALRRDPPNVGLLAERVGLSREQLARGFRSATGLTARQWWEANRPGPPPAGPS